MTINADSIRHHFGNLAPNYDQLSHRFPWDGLRHREARAISAMVGHVRNETVLDLGCGAGFYTRQLLDLGADHVFAVDWAPEMVAALPKDNVTGVCADVCQVTIDRRFKTIICAGIFEFVENPVELFRNARRHASSGGALVCLAPAANSVGRLYRCYHRTHGVIVNLFRLSDLVSMGSEAGWHIERTVKIFPSGFTLKMIANPPT